MKKFLLAILAVVCITCVGLAAASCKETQYYKLYFATAEGANVVCEIPSGYEVKSGYKVVFKVELDEDAQGEPKVDVNGEEIEADGEGFYSFKIKEDTTVEVSGVYATERNSITFDKGDKDGNDYRVTFNAEYVDADGTLHEIDTDAEKGTKLDIGTKVTFTIDVSVYYGENPRFEVLSNTQIIDPDTDGKYHIEINGKINVSIQGLELDDSFVGRKDGENVYIDGNGTADNPYKLRKPIDLYVLSSFMNNDFYWGQISTSYFSLENDIDMRGEELFIIGISDSYYFGGDFNGNGHTISNYYISSTAIDQTDFTEAFMPNIGLFGVAAGAQIYDLNLENFTCDINAAKFDTDDNREYNGFFAGGVVAYGMGVNITNCSVSGVITATAGNNKFGYIGGIIGYQLSALMETNGMRYYSTVRSCSTNVTIMGNAGCVYGVGGIAGAVRSYDENIAAMIINCYTTGDIEGAMRAGGIVGLLYPYGSVTNSYATGYVDGYTRLGHDPDYGDFRYAYAGGIAGELNYDAIIANSFFTGEVSARAAAGSNYAVEGEIAGFIGKGGNEGGAYIQSEKGLIYNCVSAADKDVTINNDYIKNTLGWSEGDWAFNGTGYPTVNTGEGSNVFDITVSFKDVTVGGNSSVIQNVANAYFPMSYWYLASPSETETHTIPEYLNGDGGLRSFGYFFDENLAVRVPNCYVPTHGVTLYAGFANYGEVAGKYYLQWSANTGNYRENDTDGKLVYTLQWVAEGDKYLELKPDGTLIYRDGALVSQSYYYYNGATITLRDTYLAIIDGKSNNAYTSFKATVDNGIMTVWDNEFYPATNPVKAVKEIENFGYGKYYATGVEYTFNTDGTGVYVNAGVKQNFTFTVNGGSIEIKTNDATLTGTVSGGNLTVDGVSLTAYDKFEGVWEKSAGSHKEYTFDGKGGWTYRYYGYNDGVLTVIDSKNGTYSPDGDGIKLSDGTKFTFNAEGQLVLGSEVYYYKQNSHAGVWNNFARMFAIEIDLKGITSDGYGEATINYGSTYGSYDVNYDVRVSTLSVVVGTDSATNKQIIETYENTPVIRLYRNDLLIASLIYRENSATLWGPVFRPDTGKSEVTTFYLYDDFKGDWVSSGYDVTFNGLGNYATEGSQEFVAVKGTATVNGKAGTYTLQNNTLTGVLECDGKTYNISFNEATGTISVTGAATFELQPRDKWYRVRLTDASGNVYSFDGKGDLAGGGTMTITAPNGTETTQTYNSGTITVSGNEFKLGSTTLYVYNPFTGEWFIANSYGEKLVIGNFSADYKASGTYYGKSYTFTYYPEGNYVTITDPADPTALPLYINVLDGNDVTELAISTSNNTEGLFSVCIGSGFDEYKGEYSYDGGTLILDGFGLSLFTDGAAKYVKDGKIVETFSYSIDEFNQVLLRSDESRLYYLFFEDADGEYQANGKHYAKVLPDNLYTVTAKDKDEVEFAFHGNGKVVTSSGLVYSYVIKNHDQTRMQYTLELTKDGVTETYVLDYSSDYGADYYTIALVIGEEESDN